MGIAKIIRNKLRKQAQDITPAPVVTEHKPEDVELIQENIALLEEKKQEISEDIGRKQKQLELTEGELTGQSIEAKSKTINKKESQAKKYNKEDVMKKKADEFKQETVSEVKPDEVNPEVKTEEVKVEESKPEVRLDEQGRPVIAAQEKTEAEKKAEEKKEEKAEEKEEKAEEKKEASFNIHFVEGKSFDTSYFVADNGEDFRAVKASRVIPANVQALILRSLADTNESPKDIVTPDEIVEQMKSQGIDSLEKFDDAVESLVTEASRIKKEAGLMAWNEAEVPKAKLPKAADGPTQSVLESEVAQGQKAHPLPKGKPSKVKQYYGRLPGAAGGDPERAINPQSSIMHEKIDLLRKSLEEEKNRADKAEAFGKGVVEEKDKLVKDNDDKNQSNIMESIVKDISAKGLLDSKKEQSAISALSKIDKKSLPHLAAFIKLLGKGKEDMVDAISPPAKLGEEKLPKVSTFVLPQFLNETEPETSSAPSLMAKYWDAK